MVTISRDTTLCISLASRPSNHGTRFHNYLYDLYDLDFIYKAFRTTDIAAAIGGVRALGIRGCSISMPYKEDVLTLVDDLHASASAIASVNTIVNSEGHLTAYNTDYVAIARLLEAKGLPTEQEFVVCGSGGMAKAVVAALRDGGYETGTVASRNGITGRALANRYGYSWRSDADELDPGIIINATPVGMADGPAEHDLPVPDVVVDGASIVFDVVAMPVETPLIQRAHRNGQQTITGADVVALQAGEQFELYTGVRPTDDEILTASAHARASH